MRHRHNMRSRLCHLKRDYRNWQARVDNTNSIISPIAELEDMLDTTLIISMHNRHVLRLRQIKATHEAELLELTEQMDSLSKALESVKSNNVQLLSQNAWLASGAKAVRRNMDTLGESHPETREELQRFLDGVEELIIVKEANTVRALGFDDLSDDGHDDGSEDNADAGEPGNTGESGTADV
ncbi:hypothetical protein BR93DRAFT_550268 [Coniochaeta sp. PMI_546]|nr:hypothetical protein BR93DRAFT_550268 [Coniochaeta sp. PMI_546]